MILEFISDMQQTTSTNAKLRILQAYKNAPIIEKLMKYAYDKITYVYGVKGNRIKSSVNTTFVTQDTWTLNEETAFKLIEDYLKALLDHSLYGNSAIYRGVELYTHLNEYSELLINILNRDLRIGVNSKQINKVFKDLIPKPRYCRCGVFSEKTAKKINFPALIQLKMDGTYREFRVENGEVTSRTRSGEEFVDSILNDLLKTAPNGYYLGELTIPNMPNRSEANGLINSDNPPYDRIVFTCWDHLSFEEYNGEKHTRYLDRLQNMRLPNDPHLNYIESHVVQNKEEALSYVSKWMQSGLEGGVLKDFDLTFKNGTSNQQLKIKLKVDADLRIVGFTEGTVGTKRQGKIGAIVFANDEGTVKGQCSGFSDAVLDEMTTDPDKYLGKIITVEFNDISKAQDNDYYALMHPRFIEFRKDKTTTDTLERIKQMRDMAMML